jgi:integrase
LIERAKARDVHHETFTPDQIAAIIGSQEDRRDRICLRLLLHYGLRKGALRAVQIKHFDHVRRRLVIFTKGQKVREVPTPDPAFWHDLERYMLDVGAEPHHYLLRTQKTLPVGPRDEHGHRRIELRRLPERPMGAHGVHRWWYRCLANAGIVPEGVQHGERMHKARHSAGQRVLDKTGNLKAVQKLLGHASIQTTADIYVDWDLDALALTMAQVLRGEDE